MQNIDESQKPYDERKKSNTNAYMYMISFLWNSFKMQNKDMMIEIRIMVAYEMRRDTDWQESWDNFLE